MTYEIDKAVPMPDRALGPRKYPFPQMEIGDSFWASSPKVATAAHNWGKVNGRKFTSRKDGDGVRVWRAK